MRRELFILHFTLFAFNCFFSAGCATPSHLQHPLLQHSPRGIYHEVQKGETLWRIAQSYHVSVDELVSVNKLSDPSRLFPGQLLFIPTASALPPVSAQRRALHASSPNNSSSHSGPLNFSWPVKGRVVSRFGGETPFGRNRGIDITGREGTQILASAAGTVSFAGEKLKGFGKTVILDHGQKLQTVYAHNQDLLVKPGESVKRHQPIARLGRTGRARHPLLHFEIRRDNRPQNPMDYLPHSP